MDKKIFWFDVETTGLDPNIHEIIQLGWMMEINGEIVDEGELKMKPLNVEAITDKALEVNKLDKEEILTWQNPREGFNELVKILAKHVNRFDKKDKAYPGGYNVHFDYSFLTAFGRKYSEYGLGAYINHMALDPLYLINYLIFKGVIDPPVNRKLETMCKAFNVDLFKAHDAFEDIRSTRELFYVLTDFMDVRKAVL